MRKGRRLFRSPRLSLALWIGSASVSLACADLGRDTGPAWTPARASPAPPVLVLVDSESGSVSILDTTTQAVAATIGVAEVGVVAVGADARQVYAAVPGGIAVVDVPARKVTRTLPLTGEPTGLAVAGNLIYVLESLGEKSRVTVLDAASGRVTLEGSVRSLAGRPEISVDGRRLFVPHNFYSGMVTVLDAATLRERRHLEFEDGAVRIHLSPDERWLLVPNGSTFDGRVTIVDAATLALVGDITLTGEPTDIAIASDSRRAWVSQFREHVVAVLDLAARRVERTIAVAEYPTRLALSPDDRTLFVIHNGSNQLSVIDVGTGAVELRQLDSAVTDIARPSRSAGAR